jgi:CMP-N-acetylneuraminic acid synthetase
MSKNNVVALIPARAGSKGIPRKNLALCGGKPLIAYTIDAALHATTLSRIIVSTDDDEIALVSRNLGAEVPFMRPRELSLDDTPMIAVLSHLLEWLVGRGSEPDAIVLLQPTSPLRRSQHIDEAVELFFRTQASSVVSVVEVPHQFNPVAVMTFENGRLAPYLGTVRFITRRQDKPRVYARNGPAVLVCRPDIIRKQDLYGEYCVPYFMSRKDSLDVDEPFDLELADKLLSVV